MTTAADHDLVQKMMERAGIATPNLDTDGDELVRLMMERAGITNPKNLSAAGEVMTGQEMFPDAETTLAATEGIRSGWDGQRFWNTEAGFSGNVAVPLLAGAGRVANTGTLGLGGAILGELGRFNAGDWHEGFIRNGMKQQGKSDAEIEAELTKLRGEDNLATQGAKWLLDTANANNAALGTWERGYTGERPSFTADVIDTIGNQGGFLAARMMYPFLGEALEAAHNAADAAMSAKEQGQYEQGLNTAPYVFGSKLAQGYLLDKAAGFAAPWIDKIHNPWTREITRAATEIPKEIMDEALDNVSERAAARTSEQGGNILNSGLNYTRNFLEEATKLPQDIKDVAATVGASTAITSALGLGARGMMYRQAQKAKARDEDAARQNSGNVSENPTGSGIPNNSTQTAEALPDINTALDEVGAGTVKNETQQTATPTDEALVEAMKERAGVGADNAQTEASDSGRYTLESGAPLSEGTENDFVLKDGQRAWGRVTEELSDGREDVPVGDIRVKVGKPGESGKGFLHAKSHEQNFKDIKFNSAEEYLEHTLGNFNLILPVGDGKHFIAVDTNQPTSPSAVLAWRNEDGGYYDLITAYPARRRTVNSQKKKSLLTGRPTPAPVPAPAPSAVDAAISSKPESNATVAYGSNDLLNKTIPQQAEGVKEAETAKELGPVTQETVSAKDEAQSEKRENSNEIPENSNKEQIKTESEQEKTEPAKETAEDSAERIRQNIKKDLIDNSAYSDDEAEQTSHVLSQYAKTLSEVSDISLEEAAGKMNMKFVKGEGTEGGERYDQIIGERGAAWADERDAVGRMNNLGVAREMEQSGKDANAIRMATGWERGKDGRWKYEILDGKIKLPDLSNLYEAEKREYDALMERLDNGEDLTEAEEKRLEELHEIQETTRKENAKKYDEYKLGDIYDAPELYNAYPALKDISVFFDDLHPGVLGEISFGDIVLSRGILETKATQNAKNTLLHEIQHVIQNIEGFGKGGNERTGDKIRRKASAWSWRNMLKTYAEKHPDIAGTLELQDRLVKEYEGMSEFLPSEYERDKGFNLYVRGYDNEGYEDAYNLATKGKVGLAKKGKDFKTYKRLSGEVEARNASARMNMTAEERRQKLLSETEDVSREDQIVLRDALGRAESYDQSMPNIPDDQTEAVRKRYEGTPQWMKAPNGKKTNLSEKQWLQVRTPAFKQWFGDWEKAATAREIRDMEAIPVTVSSVRMEEKDAQKKAKSFGEMKNDRYGVTATLSNSTVGKIIRHGGFNVTQIFDDVPRLFKNSVLALSETNDGHKQRNNVNVYHHFVSKFKADGKEYYIRFTAYELNEKKPTGKRSIHSTAISEVEVYAANKKTPTLGRSGISSPGVKGQTSFVDKKIAQVLSSVNNASKVVDENGEPEVWIHATGGQNFSVFQSGNSAGTIYFARTEKDAKRAARGKKQIMPCYLDIKNPVNTPGTAVNWYDAEDSNKVAQWKKEGHDGVYVSDEAGVSIAVFSPNQIKSATENRGTFDAGNPDIYKQNAGEQRQSGARAYTEFIRNAEGQAKAIIHMLDSADASSALHEGSHVFLETLKSLAEAGQLNEKGKVLWDTLNKELDVEKIGWHNAQEKFSASVEKYLMKGEAPTSKMRQVFEAFKDWMKKIYHSMKNITWTDTEGKKHRFNISKGMKEAMDYIFSAGTEEEADILKTLKEAAVKGDMETVTETLDTPDNPFMERAEPRTEAKSETEEKQAGQTEDKPWFEDEETERRFIESREREPKFEDKVIKLFESGEFREFKGKETASGERMAPIREAFRRMVNRIYAAPTVVSEGMKHLKALSKRQYDIFSRKRILDDLMWRKEDLPEADLPWGLTDEALKKEHEKFTRLAEKDPKITEAIAREEEIQAELNKKMIEYAEKLGWYDLARKLRNPHYFHHAIFFDDTVTAEEGGAASETKAAGGSIEKLMSLIQGRGYLKKYKGSLRDMSSNYAHVTGTIRIQQTQDMEIMRTLAEIKQKYDKSADLMAKLKPGEKLSDVIPEGYAILDPRGIGLVESGGGVTAETMLNLAASEAAKMSDKMAKDLMGPDVYKQSGLDSVTANEITEALAKHGKQLMVVPKEIKAALEGVSKARKTNAFMSGLNKITHGWKLWTLYSPFRTIKYNLRNLTGDADALLAGNPRAFKYVGQSVSDLIDVMFRGKEPKGDIRDYMERGWAQSTETHQLLNDKQLTFGFAEDEVKKLTDLQRELEAKDWKTAPKKLLRLLNKYTWGGIQHLTEFREQILRYACYLSYKNQMEEDLKRGGKGRPDNWGASLEEEVMANEDIRDRAYKMANELMGAYDQVSKTGQQLRRFAVPFYSWLEVNARRYYRLVKNGLKSDSKKDFVAGFLKGTGVKTPLYAYRLARTYMMVNLFSMACKLWNWGLFGDDDDDLPPEVQEKPHLTFGRDKNGNIIYFDRIGATADIMDWIGEDESVMPFVSTIREILNGQQTVTGWLKHATGAAFSKAVNALNPLPKTLFEIYTGRTYYPDATKPRAIRDIVDYAASSVGLSREVRALMGEPGPKYAEGALDWLYQHALYNTNPKEGAYFHILDRVRQFQERELGKTFDGAATTRRGEALRKMKTALRFNDKANVRRYLRKYYELGGTRKGLKTSIQRMGPLSGLSKEEQKQFLRWLPKDERKYLNGAITYYRELAGSLGRL